MRRHARRIATATGTVAALAGVLAAAGLSPAGAVTARPHATLYTLTFRATNLAGRPDTGDSMGLFSVDNTTLIGPAQSHATFRHGVATYHVPAGHYFALGSFGAAAPTAPATRHVVLPQITVTGNRTVAMPESAASSEVTMATPRPAAVLGTDVWLVRTGTSGPPLVFELYNSNLHGREWLNPEHVKPTVGTLRVAVNQHLESPPGSAVPYEYTLSYTDPRGVIPAQHYVATAGQLATVHERFYQPVKARGGWAFNGSLPASNANTATWFGFIEPAGPALSYPGRLTEYAGGSGAAAMEWFGQYTPVPRTPFLAGDIRLLHPGRQLTENWGGYPLHTAANVLLTSKPNMFGAMLPSASRRGNTLTLAVDPFDDNQPGHDIGWLGSTKAAKVTGAYQVDQDGTKIAGGNAVSKIPGPNGEFYTKAALPSAKPSIIRFSLQVHRTGPDYPLSDADHTVWTWHTAPAGAAKVPAGWTCVLYRRVSNCAVQPMLTLRYAVAGLSLHDAAPAGRQVLHVSVGHLQAAAASAVTRAAVSVSLDGGKTWHRAKVTGKDGRYTAVFGAPAGAKVTLRTSASDAAGGSVTETITSAYQTA